MLILEKGREHIRKNVKRLMDKPPETAVPLWRELALWIRDFLPEINTAWYDALYDLYQYDALSFEVTEDDVLTRLRQDSQPGHGVSPRLRRQVSQAIETIYTVSQPRGIYRIVPVTKTDDAIRLNGDQPLRSRKLNRLFAPCLHAVVFVTTIGDAIDAAIQDRMKSRTQYGYILDTVASLAADSVAQNLQQSIEQTLGKGLSTTLRYSPGYCDWTLAEQHKLFALLPSNRIGVALTDEALMSPRKSVSGVLGIRPADCDAPISTCAFCNKTSCPNRRT